jgi:hypothetical protein
MDPHLIEREWIRISIKVISWPADPDPHQFADVKPKCMEYEPIFKGFEAKAKSASK